jgi:hypothetical protein
MIGGDEIITTLPNAHIKSYQNPTLQTNKTFNTQTNKFDSTLTQDKTTSNTQTNKFDSTLTKDKTTSNTQTTFHSSDTQTNKTTTFPSSNTQSDKTTSSAKTTISQPSALIVKEKTPIIIKKHSVKPKIYDKQKALSIIDMAIQSKKKMLAKKVVDLEKKRKDNFLLNDSYKDYVKYYEFIKNQKKDQLTQLEMLKNYMSQMLKTENMVDEQFEAAKQDQNDIMVKINAVKKELDELIAISQNRREKKI